MPFISIEAACPPPLGSPIFCLSLLDVSGELGDAVACVACVACVRVVCVWRGGGGWCVCVCCRISPHLQTAADDIALL
jgi:hypothetical protein